MNNPQLFVPPPEEQCRVNGAHRPPCPCVKAELAYLRAELARMKGEGK